MRRSEREVKGREGIEAILTKCRTCHVAMCDGDMPYVVPLSYGYRFVSDEELELYFHCAHEGKKLDILRKNSKVCFEVSDEGGFEDAGSACDMGYFFSSIIGFGETVFLTDVPEKCEGLSAIVRHQSGQDVGFSERQVAGVCVFKIVSKEFSGKQKAKPIE